MKRVHFCALLLLNTFGANIFSQTSFTVVDSFPSPNGAAFGLTWDGQYLWSSEVFAQAIYQLNPISGFVISSFQVPTGVFGLAWRTPDIWAALDDNRIARFDPSTGALLESFSLPGISPRGLDWDGSYLWNCDNATDQIYKIRIEPATAVREASEHKLPESFLIEQNYPNPFNPETKIRFQLPNASHVVLRIINAAGQAVRTLADGHFRAGYHQVSWDGKDNDGNFVSSGVYLYQFQIGAFSQTKKMNLLR